MSAATTTYDNDPLGFIDAIADDYREQTQRLEFEHDVTQELHRQQVRDEARRRHAEQNAEHVDLPPLSRLDAFLAEPDPPVTYRIDQLWPAGGRVVFAAQQKAGKTTSIANVLRALVDGGDLFDQYPTEPVRRVILIDNELSPHTLGTAARIGDI